MPCEAEVERYRKALARLGELGLDPRYPGASIRELARRRELTREKLEAYLEHGAAKGSLVSCAYRAFAGG